MNKRRGFERKLRIRAWISNLRTAVALESAVLILGTVVIDGIYGGPILGALLVVAYQAVCGYLADPRFALAVYLIAVPNSLLGVLFLIDAQTYGRFDEPSTLLLIICALSISVVSILMLIMASAADRRRVRDA